MEKLNFVILRGFPRHSIRFAKKAFQNREIIAVEIGTLEGYNAKSILKELNIRKLYLIDPWESYKGYQEKVKTQKNLNKALNSTLKRLSKYKNKIKIVRKFSQDAVNDIPKADFIYIDGNHEYEYVKKDMENYWPKVKKGGILAGHDIASFEGVGRAFMEFCYKNKLKPHITKTDWWIVKE